MRHVAGLRVKLQLRSTGDGGKRKPILTGYRAAFWLRHGMQNGLRVYYDAELELSSTDMLFPGAEADAVLYPFHPEYWDDLQVGDSAECYEGHRLVGTATVIEKL